MARPKKASCIAPPDVLFKIAQNKERKLTRDERICVMTARRMEGHIETERQYGELFGVSSVQIHRDMSAVNDALAANHRKFGQKWESIVALFVAQYLRSVRSLWDQYSKSKKAGEAAFIARSAFLTAKEFVRSMQRMGYVPEVPHRLDVGVRPVLLEEIDNVTSRIFSAINRAGLLREEGDLENVTRELLVAFNASDHEAALTDGSLNGKGIIDAEEVQ